MTTLTDSLTAYEAETLPQDIGNRQRVQIQRAYMAGALEAAIAIRQGTKPEDLVRQAIDYGRTVGTALEFLRR